MSFRILRLNYHTSALRFSGLAQAKNSQMRTEKTYINGQWISAKSGKSLDVLNPADGSLVGTVPDMNIQDTEVAIDSAKKAFDSWKHTTARERSQILRKWYNIMLDNQKDIAEVMTAESGKCLAEANGEVVYGNSFVEWFSELGRQVRGEIIPSSVPSKKILINHQPIGVAGLITPWNFPHAMIARKAAAALAAGCTVIIKPAEDTPLTAIEMMKCADQAGFPPGVINLITSSRQNTPSIGKLLCESPKVAGISFTGSTQVGKILYNQCSGGIKRIGLELGGNAPFIVYNSAKLDKAVDGALAAKFRNCGQTCVSANRFLVQEEIFDEFVDRLVEKVKTLKMGNGCQPGVQLGPLINEAQMHKVTEFVTDAESKGARVLLGGKPRTELGKLFFEPTVLVNVKDNMLVYSEEIFGPVISLIKFKTEEESLKIANCCDLGLAGYFFSEDVSQIFRVSQNLEVGMVGVNEGIISAAEAPFGGVKQSGLGREGSHLGIEDYTYIKIQQVDGGFFERFGMLFRDAAEIAATEDQLEKEKVAQQAAEVVKAQVDFGQSADLDLDASGDHNKWAGLTPREIAEIVDSQKAGDEGEDGEESLESTTTEATEETTATESSSSDTEAEEEKDKTDLISVALNIDELYTEVLYTIIHNVGCDISLDCGQISLLSYAQDAFKVSNEKHRALLDVAESKEDPELMINVEIIEGRDLHPKDANGLSDPFVTLYLVSNTSHRYNTSVKSKTLNPMWEEHFALPVLDGNIQTDTLCLEVWDFDPAETVKEKMGKIFDVKGVKGMRKLLKEIAVTATTGQHENELIGRARIPLSIIPASGKTMPCNLEKKNKNKQGTLVVRVSFGSGKNNQVAEQEHRHIRRIVLLHELELSKVSPYWWCENFSPQADQLLTQHIAQSGLTQTEVNICSYSVYAAVHQDHHLSFTVFKNLLQKLVKPLQTEAITKDDMKLFWDATKKLLPSCFHMIVRKIRKKTPSEKALMKQVIEVLTILSDIASLESPENFNLFPSTIYPWIPENENVNDIGVALEYAVAQGAEDWLSHIIENNNNNKSTESDFAKLENFLRTIQLVRSDLQKAIEFYDKYFIDIVKFQYAKCLYKFYEAKISDLCQADVKSICQNVKRLNYTTKDYNSDPSTWEGPLADGTKLFEVYLAIQRLVTLGVGLCPAESEQFQIKKFHEWFHGGVVQWLDIAAYKAIVRIEKAVELDTLTAVDDTVKYSSSSVDTVAIFHQVKFFWRQLNWPDVESSYTFIAKMIDDICKCCVFYADQMSTKVHGMGETSDVYEKQKFEVTDEWCIAINNIDYVREALEPFSKELGVSEVVQKIADQQGVSRAERCEHTLKNVLSNSIDTVRNKIIELLEAMVYKMAPSMQRLLIEGAELCNQDSNSIHRLMRYVDDNLGTLYKQLNDENYYRTLEIVWDMLSNTVDQLIQSNVEKRRPPSFFYNLNKTLEEMLSAFRSPDDGVCVNCDSLLKSKAILRLHGLETGDLIHEINLDLASQFDNLTESPYGEIAYRCKFEGDSLQVEVMNARNLMAMDSNGYSDSFVRIHLLPEYKFTNLENPKTKCHSKNLFPLYEETFSFALTPEQRELEDGMILLSVKDKDMLGYNNQYIGEAFIHFKDVEDTSEPLKSLPSTYKFLGRPNKLDLESLRTLEYRIGDKQAKEFLKKYKQRIGNQKEVKES